MDTWQGKDCTPVTLNKYAYAGLNPFMNIDPSGNIYMISGLMAGQNGHAQLRSSAQANRVRQVQSLAGKLCNDINFLSDKLRPMHHPFPVFMGGARKGRNAPDLVEVDYNIHTTLYSLINHMLILNGLPSHTSGKQNFHNMFLNNRNDWKKSLRVVRDVSKYVDKVCDPIDPDYEPIEPAISKAMELFGVYKP